MASSEEQSHPQYSGSKDLTSTVAKHYNELQEAGRAERTKSRIVYMRNFNNWVKSVLINEYMSRLKREKDRDSTLTVLDLCSGKGGDLLKWRKANIDRLVCADIAETSVKQCEERYRDMQTRAQRDRFPSKFFSAEFITADCTKTRLLDVYSTGAEMKFDFVSCQFSFHYSFESLAQADMMVRNACECLRPGGYFIGTTPNAYELVKRKRAAKDGRSFGNEVYRVTFEPPASTVDADGGTDGSNAVQEGTSTETTEDSAETYRNEHFPLFGAKYDFHLEGVVDCPEFLVFFPAFEKLAAKYGMKLVNRVPFAEYFAAQVTNGDARSLLGKMQALEPYPNEEGVDLVSSSPDTYTTAESHVKRLKEEKPEARPPKMGTLSKEEWEALTVYTTFAFQKISEDPTDAADRNSAAKEPSRKRRHDEGTPEEGQYSQSSSGEEGPSGCKVNKQDK